MQLYNKLSSDQRSKILDASGQKRINLSFYQYAKIHDPKTDEENNILETASAHIKRISEEIYQR